MDRVEKGQTITIQASLWNEILETVEWARKFRMSTGENRSSRLENNCVLVKGPSDLCIGSAVYISGFSMSPRNAVSGNGEFTVMGTVNSGKKTGSFCPGIVVGYEHGNLYDVQISGLALAKVKSTTTLSAKDKCDLLDDNDGFLRKFQSGRFQIVAVKPSDDSDTADGEENTYVCLVRFVEQAKTNIGEFCIGFDAEMEDTIICHDSSYEDNAVAGHCYINNLLYTVQKKTYAKPASGMVYCYLKATYPYNTETQSEQTAGAEIEFTTAEVTASSQPGCVYYYIGSVNCETEEISQAHAVGPIKITWIGPVYDVLEKYLEDNDDL